MKLSYGLFLALAAPASALRAGSKIGAKLLQNARRLDGEANSDWVANYSIKFSSCHTLVQVADEEGENGSLIYNKNLVTFHLCPTDTCSSHQKDCGKYVVGMEVFVDAWTEAKLEAEEWACEYVRENCYCDNANDDEVCENQCYADAGLDYCVEYEGQEAFEVQEYLECGEIENQNGNNNNANYQDGNGNYYYQAFVGPYCSSDGKSIHLGVFYDEFCGVKGDDSIYGDMNYGATLPYSSGVNSLVEGDCISCKEPDENDGNNGNNNGDDQQDEDKVIQMCEEMYQMSGRCESNVVASSNYQYIDTSGCEYINNILPKLEQNSKSVKSANSSGGGKASVVLAWLFGVTTLALGVYAFLLFRKLRRSKVNLSEQGTGGDMS